MSELAWSAVVVILLVFVGLLFIVVWHGGEKPNGLKGELEERVNDLEADSAKVWQELKRLANRWIP